jgi:hypothetical protein
MMKDLRIGAEATFGNDLRHVRRLMLVTFALPARRRADTQTARSFVLNEARIDDGAVTRDVERVGSADATRDG